MKPANVAALMIIHGLGILGLVYIPPNAELLALAACAIMGILLFGLVLGFHRLLSHRSYRLPKPLEMILAILGTFSLQAGPIRWVSTHRYHHSHADSITDPHTPRKGKFWAYVAWTCYAHPHIRCEQWAPDLLRSGFYRFLERYSAAISVSCACVVFGVGWAGTGSAGTGVTAVLYGYVLPIAWSWHVTFAVNAFAHRKNSRDEWGALDCWWLAIPSFGDALHESHHERPSRARYGTKWYHADIAYWVLALFNKLRVVELKS